MTWHFRQLLLAGSARRADPVRSMPNLPLCGVLGAGDKGGVVGVEYEEVGVGAPAKFGEGAPITPQNVEKL